MKKIEAVFYNEDKLQNALGMLRSFGVDIKKAEVSSGGKSLREQTFDRAYGEEFGSATGFVYSTTSFPKNTPSLEAYPMPEALAYVADDLASTTHRHGMVPDAVGGVGGDVSGEVFALSIKTPSESLGSVEAILNKNGAKRVRILS